MPINCTAPPSSGSLSQIICSITTLINIWSCKQIFNVNVHDLCSDGAQFSSPQNGTRSTSLPMQTTNLTKLILKFQPWMALEMKTIGPRRFLCTNQEVVQETSATINSLISFSFRVAPRFSVTLQHISKFAIGLLNQLVSFTFLTEGLKLLLLTLYILTKKNWTSVYTIITDNFPIYINCPYRNTCVQYLPCL
jgi:hypothetical protein